MTEDTPVVVQLLSYALIVLSFLPCLFTLPLYGYILATRKVVGDDKSSLGISQLKFVWLAWLPRFFLSLIALAVVGAELLVLPFVLQVLVQGLPVWVLPVVIFGELLTLVVGALLLPRNIPALKLSEDEAVFVPYAKGVALAFLDAVTFLIAAVSLLLCTRSRQLTNDRYIPEGKNFAYRHRYVAKQFLMTFVDLVLLLPLAVVFLTHWRWHEFRAETKGERDNLASGDEFAVRVALLVHAIGVFCDLPAFLLAGVVVVSHRSAGMRRDFSAAANSTARRWVCLWHFLQLIIDVPFILLGLLTLVLPWRPAVLVISIRRTENVDYPHENIGKSPTRSRLCREIVVQQFLLMLLDLPVLVGYTLIVLTRYRFVNLRDKLRTLREERLPAPRRSVFFVRSLDMTWSADMDMASRWASAFQAHGTVLLELFQLVVDIPFVVLGALTFLTLWRAPELLESLRDPSLGAEQRRMKAVDCAVSFLFVDVVVLAVGVLCLCTFGLYRIPNVISGFAADDCDAKLASSRNAIILHEIGQALVDLPFLILGLVTLCTVYRAIPLIRDIFFNSQCKTSSYRRYAVFYQFIAALLLPLSLLSFALVLLTYYRFGNVRTDFAQIQSREDERHGNKSHEDQKQIEEPPSAPPLREDVEDVASIGEDADDRRRPKRSSELFAEPFAATLGSPMNSVASQWSSEYADGPRDGVASNISLVQCLALLFSYRFSPKSSLADCVEAHLVCMWQLISLLVDLPFMLLAVPVILSWRHVTFRADLSAANQRHALPRLVCAQQFLWFLSDLPFVLVGTIIVLATFWYGRGLLLLRDILRPDVRRHRNARTALFRFMVVVQHLLLVPFDLVCIIFAPLLFVSMYRLPTIKRDVRDQTSGFTQQVGAFSEFRSRMLQPHFIVISNGFSLFIDLPFIVLGAVVTLTVWRAPILWRSMFPTYERGVSERRKSDEKSKQDTDPEFEAASYETPALASSHGYIGKENLTQVLNVGQEATAPLNPSQSFQRSKHSGIFQSRHKRSLSHGHIPTYSFDDDVTSPLRMPSTTATPPSAEYESFTSKRSDFTKPSSSEGSLTSMYTGGVTESARSAKKRSAFAAATATLAATIGGVGVLTPATNSSPKLTAKSIGRRARSSSLTLPPTRRASSVDPDAPPFAHASSRSSSRLRAVSPVPSDQVDAKAVTDLLPRNRSMNKLGESSRSAAVVGVPDVSPIEPTAWDRRLSCVAHFSLIFPDVLCFALALVVFCTGVRTMFLHRALKGKALRSFSPRVGLRGVTKSYRANHRADLLVNIHNDFGLYRSVVSQFLNLLLDLPLVPLGIIVCFTWRAFFLVAAFRMFQTADDYSDVKFSVTRRLIVVMQFGLLILDIPAFVCMTVITFTVWRYHQVVAGVKVLLHVDYKERRTKQPHEVKDAKVDSVGVHNEEEHDKPLGTFARVPSANPVYLRGEEPKHLASQDDYSSEKNTTAESVGKLKSAGDSDVLRTSTGEFDHMDSKHDLGVDGPGTGRQERAGSEYSSDDNDAVKKGILLSGDTSMDDAGETVSAKGDGSEHDDPRARTPFMQFFARSPRTHGVVFWNFAYLLLELPLMLMSLVILLIPWRHSGFKKTLVHERDNSQRRWLLGKQALLLLLDLPLAAFYVVLLFSWRNPNIRAATNPERSLNYAKRREADEEERESDRAAMVGDQGAGDSLQSGSDDYHGRKGAQPNIVVFSSSDEASSDSTGNSEKSVHWAFFHIAVIREFGELLIDVVCLVVPFFVACSLIVRIPNAIHIFKQWTEPDWTRRRKMARVMVTALLDVVCVVCLVSMLAMPWRLPTLYRQLKRNKPAIVVSQVRASGGSGKDQAHDPEHGRRTASGQYDDIVVARVDGVPVFMREQDMMPDYMAKPHLAQTEGMQPGQAVIIDQAEELVIDVPYMFAALLTMASVWRLPAIVVGAFRAKNANERRRLARTQFIELLKDLPAIVVFVLVLLGPLALLVVGFRAGFSDMLFDRFRTEVAYYLIVLLIILICVPWRGLMALYACTCCGVADTAEKRRVTAYHHAIMYFTDIPMVVAATFVYVCIYRVPRMRRLLREGGFNVLTQFEQDANPGDSFFQATWRRLGYHWIVFREFCGILVDIPYGVLALVPVVCCWRADYFAITFQDRTLEIPERRRLCVVQAFESILDLPFVVLLVVALVPLYRVPNCFRGFSEDRNPSKWRGVIAYQCLQYLIDLPFLIFGACSLFSGIRTVPLVRDLHHAPPTSKHRRTVAAQQFGLLLADIFSFVMFLPLLVTVYRLPGLLKSLREISRRPACGAKDIVASANVVVEPSSASGVSRPNAVPPLSDDPSRRLLADVSQQNASAHDDVQELERKSDEPRYTRFEFLSGSRASSSSDDSRFDAAPSRRNRKSKFHHSRSSPNLQLSFASATDGSSREFEASPMVFTSLRNLDNAGADTQRVFSLSSPFDYLLSASASPHFNFQKGKKEAPKSQPHVRTNTKRRKNSHHEFSSRQASVSSPPGMVLLRSQSARAGNFAQPEPNLVPERIAVDKGSPMKFSSAEAKPFLAPDTFEVDGDVDEKTHTGGGESAASNVVVHKRTKSEPHMSHVNADRAYDASRDERPRAVGDADVDSERERRGEELRAQTLSEPLWNLLGFWRVYEPGRSGLRFASHGAVASQFVSLLIDLPFIILGALVALSFRSNSMRSKMPSTPPARRASVFREFLCLLRDLPFFLLGVLVSIVGFYRARAMWRSVRNADADKRYEILARESLAFVIDIPFIVMGAVALFSVIRTPLLIRDLVYHTNDARSRRLTCFLHFILIFMDLLTFACALPILVSLYRTRPLYKRLISTRDNWRKRIFDSTKNLEREEKASSHAEAIPEQRSVVVDIPQSDESKASSHKLDIRIPYDVEYEGHGRHQQPLKPRAHSDVVLYIDPGEPTLDSADWPYSGLGYHLPIFERCSSPPSFSGLALAHWITIKEFVSLICDVPFIALGLVVSLSWRSRRLWERLLPNASCFSGPVHSQHAANGEDVIVDGDSAPNSVKTLASMDGDVFERELRPFIDGASLAVLSSTSYTFLTRINRPHVWSSVVESECLSRAGGGPVSSDELARDMQERYPAHSVKDSCIPWKRRYAALRVPAHRGDVIEQDIAPEARESGSDWKNAPYRWCGRSRTIAAEEFIQLLIDIPFVVVGILLTFSVLRTIPVLMDVFKHCKTAGERRMATAAQLKMLIYDVVILLPSAIILLISVYRINATKETVRATGVPFYAPYRPSSRTLPYFVVLGQAINVIIDIPYFVMTAVILCSAYRTMPFIRGKRDQGLRFDDNSARHLVGHQFFQLLIDIPYIMLGIIGLILTPWKILGAYRSIRRHDADTKSLRKLAWHTFVDVLPSYFAIIGAVLVLVTVWRLPTLRRRWKHCRTLHGSVWPTLRSICLDVYHVVLALVMLLAVIRVGEFLKQAKLAKKLYLEKRLENDERDARQAAALEEGDGEAIVVEGGEGGDVEQAQKEPSHRSHDGDRDGGEGGERSGEADELQRVGEGPGEGSHYDAASAGEALLVPGAMMSSKAMVLTPKGGEGEDAFSSANDSRRISSEHDQKSSESSVPSDSQSIRSLIKSSHNQESPIPSSHLHPSGSNSISNVKAPHSEAPSPESVYPDPSPPQLSPVADKYLCTKCGFDNPPPFDRCAQCEAAVPTKFRVQTELALERNARLQCEYDLKLNAVRAQREQLRSERERERRERRDNDPEPDLNFEREHLNWSALDPKPASPEVLAPPTEYTCPKCTYINKLSYFRDELRSKVCEICDTPFESGFVAQCEGINEANGNTRLVYEAELRAWSDQHSQLDGPRNPAHSHRDPRGDNERGVHPLAADHHPAVVQNMDHAPVVFQKKEDPYDADPEYAYKRAIESMRNLEPPDSPLTLTFYYPLIRDQCWRTFSRAHHLLLAPIKLLAFLLLPIYLYLALRIKQFDATRKHEAERRERGEPVDPKEVSVTFSYLMLPMARLFQLVPPGDINFWTMERFFVYTLIGLPPLLCNEVAVLVFALHALFAKALTLGLSHQFRYYFPPPVDEQDLAPGQEAALSPAKTKQLAAALSVLLQAATLPVLVLVEVSIAMVWFFAFNPAWAVESSDFFTSFARLSPNLEPIGMWAVQAVWIFVWLASMQLLFRYVRHRCLFFRPWTGYKVLLMTFVDGARGKGRAWKFYRNILVRTIHILHRINGSCGILGKLVAELSLLVAVLLWSFWPAIIPVALGEFVFAAIPGVVGLLFLYRAVNIARNWAQNEVVR